MSTLNSSAADKDRISRLGPVGSADPGRSEAGQRRDIPVAVCIALLPVIAAVIGLGVAQPPFALDLHASEGGVEWMIDIYAITLVTLLLPFGDR